MKTTHLVEANEIAILGRIIGRDKGGLSTSVARYLLSLDFTEEDKTHMHDLAVRNQEGTLSAAEREELVAYAKAGCLLGIFHAKARKTLRQRKKVPLS